MSWIALILLILSMFIGSVDSKFLGLPNAIKEVAVASGCVHHLNCAEVKWKAYESDNTFYKVEFVGTHDGKSKTVTIKASKHEPARTTSYSLYVEDLKINETYIVRIFAINARGQSPPSPEVIYFLDPDRIDHWQFGTRIMSENPPLLESIQGSQVNITWHKVAFRTDRRAMVTNPVKYAIRYGNNKNTSLWKTLNTYNTWITLDDLEKGTQYSGYVTAEEEGEEGLKNTKTFTIPISLDENITGLPKPVITIEPAYKNGVFASRDLIIIRCSIPLNTNPEASMKLSVGERHEMAYKNAHVTPITIVTTADTDVTTAECTVHRRYDQGVPRASYRSWEVTSVEKW